MQFDVIQGDIAAQKADALVNAAGTSLRMGSGVAGALRQAAGDELNEAAIAAGPVELGAAAVTDAFALDAEYVIHAAAMPHYGDGKATERSIRVATRNALVAAEEHDCASVVVPVLGTGVAGFAFEEGARFVCEEIAAFDADGLSDVRVIAYGDDSFETLTRVADELRPA